MFNKEEYWAERQLKKEGKYIKPVPVSYAKGAIVKRIKNGIEVEVVNGIGENLVKTKRGLQRLNRKETRSRQRNRFGSASNYKRVKENYGFEHEVNKPHHELQLPVYPAHITNHLRHKERQVKRELNRA